MKDKISVELSINRFEKNLGKINDEIRTFVSKLKELCEVKDYNLIKLKIVNPDEK